MDITLIGVSKRYGYQTILKDINLTLKSGDICGIAGGNGSGKSTLLQMISSYLSPSEGKITYARNTINVHRNEVYKYTSYSAPYITLPPNFTPQEVFNHHVQFKQNRFSRFEDFISYCDLSSNGNKAIGSFSSGMTQRLALGLSMSTQSSLLLLDEPTSFLDHIAKAWFIAKLQEVPSDVTIVIASNEEGDLALCKQVYPIMDKTIVVG